METGKYMCKKKISLILNQGHLLSGTELIDISLYAFWNLQCGILQTGVSETGGSTLWEARKSSFQHL